MKTIIKIKKRSQPWFFMGVLIVMPFALGLLNELMGLPYGVRYIMDLAWLILLAMLVVFRRKTRLADSKPIVVWISMFWLMTLAVFPVQMQSPLYYLWGLRNNFRFYVAFFAFVAFLLPADIDDYIKLFDELFWVDIAVCIFQFFVLNVKNDDMGGMFSATGGNSFNNIFLLIILTKSTVFSIEGKENVWLCALKYLLTMLVAAMSELKFLFIEAIIVLVLAVLFTNFTWRKLLLIVGGGAALAVGIVALNAVFPFWGQWFSLEWFIKTATSDVGYTGSGDLNRLTAIPRINELWLKNGLQRIFGMGLGNCDTASFAIVNTPFFLQYGDLHYTWLSYAMIYLETGWIGLAFYYGFFVLVYLGVRKIEKRSEGLTQTYCRMGRILAIMCMIIAVYNASLRTEAGYMMFFALAVPFALDRGKKECRTDVEKSVA